MRRPRASSPVSVNAITSSVTRTCESLCPITRVRTSSTKISSASAAARAAEERAARRTSIWGLPAGCTLDGGRCSSKAKSALSSTPAPTITKLTMSTMRPAGWASSASTRRLISEGANCAQANPPTTTMAAARYSTAPNFLSSRTHVSSHRGRRASSPASPLVRLSSDYKESRARARSADPA